MMFRPKKLKSNLILAMALMTGVTAPSYANTIITDVQINSLITQAIETHPLVRSAQAEREATAEGINAAKLNLLPTPSVTTSYNDNDNLVSELGVRQPLWTGGRLTANVNQAIFDDKAATENIYEQQNQVAKTTIEAWQTYITAVTQQRVYLENLSQLRDFEAMMQRRVNQGVSARIELDLVSNRILQETNAYEAAREQQHIAEARLQQITGHPLPAGSDHQVPALSRLVEQAKMAAAGFERMAFDNASFYNPTVVKEQFQIESAKQEVRAQNASKFPVLYAEYKHTFDHDKNTDDGRFFVGLNYQPGAGFSNIALTRASEARVRSLIESKDAAQRNVMENIQVQYQQFASAKSRELSLVSAVAGAQIVLESYQRQFKAGRKSWLEVLNAVRELSDYQIQLVQTRSNILGAFYKLQVDFGVMPWQQRFINNRQEQKLFNVMDPVKEWMNKQPNTVNNNHFGYGQNSGTTLNNGGFNTVNLDSNSLNSNDDYINISLPASVEQQLDQGSYIMIDDQGQPVVVKPDVVTVATQSNVAATEVSATDLNNSDNSDKLSNPEPAAEVTIEQSTAIVETETVAVPEVPVIPEPVFPGYNKPKANFPEEQQTEQHADTEVVEVDVAELKVADVEAETNNVEVAETSAEQVDGVSVDSITDVSEDAVFVNVEEVIIAEPVYPGFNKPKSHFFDESDEDELIQVVEAEEVNDMTTDQNQ